jgi:hypothetical protein
MSTKTLRKRIALVAVTALGAGLLAVVPVSSANAGAGDIAATNTSVGLLKAPTIAAGSTTMTATLLSTGSLKVTADAAGGYYVVTGDAFISATSGTATTIEGNQKAIAAAGSDVFTVTPTGAVGSTFTVSGYSSKGAALVSLLVVTIAGASVAGVVSPAESGIYWSSISGSTVTAATTADAAGASVAEPTKKLALNVILKDGYGAAINSTTGALVATVSSGAAVSIGTNTTTTTGTFTTAVSNASPHTTPIIISVTEATAGAGWKGTVTVTYNGVVVATKSGSIAGYASAITLKRNVVASANGSTVDAVGFMAKDAAGNPVVITPGSLTMKSSSNESVVSNVVGVTAEDISAANAEDGKATVTCGTPGTSSVVMQYITPAGKTVLTAPLTVICGATADTYTASWDKASYAQGEIATLTVSFKDKFGAPATSASAVTALTGLSPNTSNEVISTPMLTLIGSISSAVLKTDANGQLVYKYSVGATGGITPGAYQASVSFPTVNSANGAAQAVGYTVTAGAGVSNADVLKAIVSLIASINKQIAALQKALLRR